MRTVAIVSAAYPYPVDSGKRVVLSGLVAHFGARLGADHVHYVLLGGSPAVPSDQLVLHRVPGPGRAEQLLGAAVAVTTGRRSLQEAVLRSRRATTALGEVLGGIGADLEVYDTVRLGQYAAGVPRRAGVRRVLYLDDLFSERYDHLLAAAAADPTLRLDPLGEFGGHLPAAARRLLDVPAVQRGLLRLERRLVARSEDAQARTFDRALLVNPGEAARLRARTGVGHVGAIPPLVRVPAAPPRAYAGAPEFVFLGLLTLPHNAAALQALLTRVLPAALARRPDLRLTVLGRGASEHLRALAAPLGDRVQLAGFVDDLDAVLGGAAALLNPLPYGGGVKLKVLEALARGLPVVSTRVGVDGVADGPEQGCLVADDLARWPALLEELTDPVRNAQVGEAGRRHFAAAYSAEAVGAAYDVAFGP